MFRKLAGLAGVMLRTDFRPLLATVAIGYGIGQFQNYAKDRQRYLAQLDALIEAAEARYAELAEKMAATAHLREPYPAQEDLDPLARAVELDLAAAPA